MAGYLSGQDIEYIAEYQRRGKEITRLRAELEEAKELLRKSDAMQQLAYANGMKEGWNLGDTGDSETHSKRVAALVQEAVADLRACARFLSKKDKG